MWASTKPGIRMLSRCSISRTSFGSPASSSRAGPTEPIWPCAVTSSPSSRNSKLPGSSCEPGSERKWSIAPRCAHTPFAESVRCATIDPGEHFGPLLFADAGNVAYRHGTGRDLLTDLCGAREDALGCIEQYAVRGRSQAGEARVRGMTARAAQRDNRLDANEAAGASPPCTGAGCAARCGHERDRDTGQREYAQGCGERRGVAVTFMGLVPRDEIDAQQHPCRANDDEHQPVFAGTISHRIVMADHHEQHR